MEHARPDDPLGARIAARLRALRAERQWSLEDLARLSGVSRATLSRLEKADVSATAQQLGRLCAAFGLPLSRLMLMIEGEFPPLMPQAAQPIWRDPATGFTRRSVSPPATALAGEAIEGRLPAGTIIEYPLSPRPGLEHHLILLEGALSVTIEGETHHLAPGDCLRYRLFGASVFCTPPAHSARYFLFMV